MVTSPAPEPPSPASHEPPIARCLADPTHARPTRARNVATEARGSNRRLETHDHPLDGELRASHADAEEGAGCGTTPRRCGSRARDCESGWRDIGRTRRRDEADGGRAKGDAREGG